MQAALPCGITKVLVCVFLAWGSCSLSDIIWGMRLRLHHLFYHWATALIECESRSIKRLNRSLVCGVFKAWRSFVLGRINCSRLAIHIDEVMFCPSAAMLFEAWSTHTIKRFKIFLIRNSFCVWRAFRNQRRVQDTYAINHGQGIFEHNYHDTVRDTFVAWEHYGRLSKGLRGIRQAANGLRLPAYDLQFRRQLLHHFLCKWRRLCKAHWVFPITQYHAPSEPHLFPEQAWLFSSNAENYFNTAECTSFPNTEAQSSSPIDYETFECDTFANRAAILATFDAFDFEHRHIYQQLGHNGLLQSLKDLRFPYQLKKDVYELELRNQ